MDIEVNTMFIYTNPNPTDKRIGDCVIRAIAIATSTTWESAYIALCKEGLSMADLPNSNAVWGAYLKKLGFTRHTIPDTCPDCYTVEDFCEDHPHGTYVLCTGSHTVTVMDGNAYDAWNSLSEIPTFYYKEEEYV
jgi:hypothetical protein